MQDIDRLASSVYHFAAHCFLILYCVQSIYDVMERRSFSNENEREGAQLFLSHQVPMLRKWPNLRGNVSFRAFPRTWLHYMETKKAVTAFEEGGDDE